MYVLCIHPEIKVTYYKILSAHLYHSLSLEYAAGGTDRKEVRLQFEALVSFLIFTHGPNSKLLFRIRGSSNQNIRYTDNKTFFYLSKESNSTRRPMKCNILNLVLSINKYWLHWEVLLCGVFITQKSSMAA